MKILGNDKCGAFPINTAQLSICTRFWDCVNFVQNHVKLLKYVAECTKKGKFRARELIVNRPSIKEWIFEFAFSLFWAWAYYFENGTTETAYDLLNICILQLYQYSI
jgi:hypothetical protein